MIFIEQLIQDLRYAARGFRGSPSFTAVVVLTLALGIGLNTAVFSAIHAVLLRAVALPDPDRLVWLAKYDKQYLPQNDVYVISADYSAFHNQNHSFAAMTAYANDDLALMANGEATQERIAFVTGEFWQMTNARPAIGHLFSATEPHTIVLTHALFERRFASDPHVLGQTVTLNGFPFTVVGVLGADYQLPFPYQWNPGEERRAIDAYIPIPPTVLTMPPVNWRAWEALLQQVGPAPSSLCVAGKLKPGISLVQARADIERIYRRMVAADPSMWHIDEGVRMSSLKEKIAGGTRPAFVVAAGAAGFVLLIACANVANLLLARALPRRRETAIRSSLGAGRGRIIKQLLTESVLLALLGGAAGLLLGRWSLAVLIRLGSSSVPRLADARIDGHALLFALAISLFTGLLFALAPWLATQEMDLHSVLRGESGTLSAARGPLRFRGFLVAAELALAVVLLSGAALMLKSLWRMTATPLAADPAKILIMNISLDTPKYVGAWPRQSAFLRAVLDRVAGIPGVAAVGLDCGTLHTSISLQGASANKQTEAALRAVSPGYLRVLGVPLVRGHWPSKGEEFAAFTVNQALAREIDGGRDPLGKQMQGSFLSQRIAGVVSDFKHTRLDAEPAPEVYIAYQFFPNILYVKVLVRTAIATGTVLPAIRQVVRNIDPGLPIYDVQTLEQSLSDSIAPRRFHMFLLGVFGTLAVVLAVVGIYGTVAYHVAGRVREIGIRMALGANSGDVVILMVRQAAGTAIAGTAIGLGMSTLLTRLMASLLYGLKPGDPETLMAAAAILLTAAFVASIVPALKAANVDPITALHQD